MTMPLYQNDPRLSAEPSIGTHGCLVTVLKEMCEAEAMKALTPEDILTAYRWLKDRGTIQDDDELRAFVWDHTITMHAFQYYLGVPQTGKYVFRRDAGGGKHDFNTGQKPNYWAAYGKIEGASIGHFWRIHEDREVAFDPLWPARKKLGTLSIRGYLL